MSDIIGNPGPAMPAPTILCVDDEPNILASLKRLFRPAGYRILSADSGQAGLQLLEAEPVDLVISDMRMPEMDGARFLERVRARWPATVRLLLTGHADVASIIEAINRGEIYRYITKPWDDNDILLLVRHALERRALEREKLRLEALALRQNAELKALNASLEARVEARTAELKTALNALLEANGKLKANFITSIKVFSQLIDMRAGQLGGHLRRVADLARKIGQKMALSDKEMQDLFVASLLHEIGKIGFSDDLLAMPVDLMRGDDLSHYRKHPLRAEQLLMPLVALRDVASILRAQLERFDGGGFPDAAAGSAIPIGARILMLASDYDNLQLGALTTRHLRPEEARAVILHQSAKRYDPQVVAAFNSVVTGAPDEVKEDISAETRVAPADLLSGMVLARDLLAPDGLLLLSVDHVLDERLIEQIRDFDKSGAGRLHVHVLKSSNVATARWP
jgi:response regulator RpfG family c-di-GMP phosphodiesterase